jgi:hypothetical protein
MSTESAADRRRKRIVEHTIKGFTNAQAAITFGNTVERVILDKIGDQKYRQYIGSPDTKLAITPKWLGKTVLKNTFLDLEDDVMASYVCYQMKQVQESYNEVHKTSISIVSSVVRGKPQPQYIGC